MKNSMFNKEDDYSSDEDEQLGEATGKNERASSSVSDSNEEVESDHDSEDSEISEHGKEVLTDPYADIEADADADEFADADDFVDAKGDLEEDDSESNDADANEEIEDEDDESEKLTGGVKVGAKTGGKSQKAKGERKKVTPSSKNKKLQKMKSAEFMQKKRVAGGGLSTDHQGRINVKSDSQRAAAFKSTSTLSMLQPKKKRPSTQVMVDEAIKSLNERTGSSAIAIRKYIMNNHPHLDGPRTMLYIKKYIKKALSSGKLQLTKGVGLQGSFKLSAESRRKEEMQLKLKQKRMNEKARKQKIKEIAAIKKSPTGKKEKKTTSNKKLKPKKSKALMELNKSLTTAEKEKTTAPPAATPAPAATTKAKSTPAPLAANSNSAPKKMVKSVTPKKRAVEDKENTLRTAKSASAIEKKKPGASRKPMSENKKTTLSASVTTLGMQSNRNKLNKLKMVPEANKMETKASVTQHMKSPVAKSKKSPLSGGDGDGGATYAARHGIKGRKK